jgi:hypothetical protein
MANAWAARPVSSASTPDPAARLIGVLGNLIVVAEAEVPKLLDMAPADAARMVDRLVEDGRVLKVERKDRPGTKLLRLAAS